MARSPLHYLFLFATLLVSSTHALVPVAQSPLAGTGDTDGPNVLLALSIEYPTASWAYSGVWKKDNEYLGYFNPDVCYRYVENDSAADVKGVNYFKPVAWVRDKVDRSCDKPYWSGNFLNWAAGTATDIFRKALTGGYRLVDSDTSGATILRLSRHGYGEETRTAADSTVSRYVPMAYAGAQVTIQRKGNFGVRFSFDGNSYDYDLNVMVCGGASFEDYTKDCAPYVSTSGNGYYKPEGLIQKYAKTMRVGVFSYLLDNAKARDGGVLRARLKYPGCDQTVTTNTGKLIKLQKEWNPKTGVYYNNPDPDDATSSNVSNSGVINYLNRFGEGGYKTLDPAAELYYAALRYLRNTGNYAAYSNTTSNNQKDSFPVIENWDDPLRNSDQNSFVIYFGDINTHRDVDLPGSLWNKAYDKNDLGLRKPSDDTSINVDALLRIVRGGVVDNIGAGESPGYIAALAYWGNVYDIRPDKSGKQTVKAFMIDANERGDFKTPSTNSFYLAAKWGSFTDENNNDKPDVDAEWSTGVQSPIEAFSYYKQATPDNYAPANDPAALIKALNRAFRYAALAVKPSLSGLAVSSGNNAVNTGSHLFRTTFERSPSDSTDWYGDVEVYKVTLTSNMLNSSALSQDWSTRDVLETQLGSKASSRNVYAYDKSTRRGISFDSASAYLQGELKLSANGLAYLRGDNTNAGSNGTKAYRARSYRLGPIELAKVAFGGAPEALAGCGTFSDDIKKRPSIYAVPANDGFLHIFNYGDKNVADKGKELFAFMPSAVYPQAAKLAAKEYEYLRLHDGSPVIKDVCLSSAAKTVLIGSSGRGITKSDGYGSSSIYAIDVTNPGSMSKESVLWEFSSDIDSMLGNTMTLPKLVKLNNGRWAAVMGNGINQTGGKAGVFLLMLDKPPGEQWQLGSNYFRFTVSPDSTPLYSPNGIADVSTYDDDGNGTADYLYAGDLNGHVWKFDISAANPANWNVALDGKPLFTAHKMKGATLGERQPITAAPVLMKTAGGQKVVVFGTGINYAETDRGADGQAIYGVYDNNKQAGTPADLLALAMPSADSGFTRTDSGTPTASQNGWYFPLTQNEQVVSAPFYLGMKKNDLVVIDSIRLRQECAAGGEASFRTIVSLASGAAPETVLMDTNGDGKISSSDTKYNRQSLSTGVNYGGSLRLTLPGNKQALCNTGAGGTIECNTLGSGTRTVRRVSWREITTP